MKKLVTALLFIFIIMNIINMALLYFSSNLFLTPDDSASGLVSFEILNPPSVFIHSPENITYNFDYSDFNNYSIILNVSSNFGADLWRLKHEDLKHNGVIIKDNYGFAPETPNLTIETVRWSNRLTIFGENTNTGIEANASVIFYINVSNHEPILGDFSNETYICEGNVFVPIEFNATDVDEDNIELGATDSRNDFFAFEINAPPDVIYEGTLGISGRTFASNLLYLLSPGGNVSKRHIGLHEITLRAKDNGIPEEGITKKVNFTVIETNNAPIIKGITNETIEVDLDNSNHTLYITINVADIEDGDANSGNLTFNATFLSGGRIFNVSSFGIINFTADISQLGFYEIRVCVSDLGLHETRIHENISLCGESAANVKTACQDFNLTITKDLIIIESFSRGGGGGGGGGICKSIWNCEEWPLCQKTAEALTTGILTGETYRTAKDKCSVNFFSEDFCGFQTRSCVDYNNCTTQNKLEEMQACYYTENPTCFDNIKNCHDGSCEFLVDCGGPCKDCPTCSDGIQNQGEEKIDCGGPCPTKCSLEIPSGTVFLNYFFTLAITISLIIVIIVIYRYVKTRRKLD